MSNAAVFIQVASVWPHVVIYISLGYFSDQGMTLEWNMFSVPSGYPHILENPALKAVEKDRNTNLQCSASGTPEPTIMWLKDYIPIDTTDPRLKILAGGIYNGQLETWMCNVFLAEIVLWKYLLCFLSTKWTVYWDLFVVIIIANMLVLMLFVNHNVQAVRNSHMWQCWVSINLVKAE